MLKQVEILQAVTALLKSRYPYQIYTAEVKEGFVQPYFFIKFTKQKTVQTKSFNSNILTVIITYFTTAQEDRETEFMEIVDGITEIFGLGFYAGKRYLHVGSVSDQRVGEEKNILQISIDLPYFECTGYNPDEGYDKMQEVGVNYSLKS